MKNGSGLTMGRSSDSPSCFIALRCMLHLLQIAIRYHISQGSKDETSIAPTVDYNHYISDNTRRRYSQLQHCRASGDALPQSSELELRSDLFSGPPNSLRV